MAQRALLVIASVVACHAKSSQNTETPPSSAVLCSVYRVFAPRKTLLGKDLSKQIDEAVIAPIRDRPDVVDVLPRLDLMVAAVGRSGFFGQESNFQVFGDGVAPDQIAGDPAVTAAFQDWDSADDGKRVACAPPQASAQSVSCPDSKHYYCDETDRTCHRRVPAVISRTLLDLYNVQFAKANGLPIIDDLATFIQVHEMHFTIGLGQASGAASLLGDIGQAKRKVEAELVGISPRAVAIGLTFPMAYVRRWNREFGNPNATSSFSSLDVTLGSDAVAGFAQWLQVTLALETEPVFGTSASCPK